MPSDRLVDLAKGGLISRKVIEGPPIRSSYELTDRGRTLMPALEQIVRWQKNLPQAHC